jgi:hypothetical protein
MIRGTMVPVLVLSVLGMPVQAQTRGPLRWQAGQALVYQVEHTTKAFDKREEVTSETKSTLKVLKRWQVLAVDAAGVATLQLSLTAMIQEVTTPSGDVLRFDSANPEKGTPQLKGMANFLNKPLATIRVDSYGRVVEVKESKSDASSFEHELPFLCSLPAGVKAGQTWDRTYKITLAPPLGTGEKYDAVQRFTCKSVTGNLATVVLSTELKAQPKVAADAIPLWQMLPQGEVVFDLAAGRLQSAKLAIEKELKNHQGEGSHTKFSSVLTITWVGAK